MFLAPQTGEDYNTSNEAAGEAMTARAKKEFGDKLYSTSQIYAYMQFKFQCTSQPGVGILNVFRSADMYLIQAEADCHIPGKEAEAQALLNELNKERDPAYTCTKTGAALLEEVKLYRRIELWGEGSDWFDCKRWGQKIERHSEPQGSFHSSFATTINPADNNKWTWVYPTAEVDFNGSINNYAE